MTHEEKHTLVEIVTGNKWEISSKLLKFLETVEVEEVKEKRTSIQSDSLFLWYSQIEKICENAGITWDRLIQHTHQLKVTKENLHEAGKQLQKALWGKASTKELEKQKQINELVAHFADWFGKEGIEVPPFPSKELQHYEQIAESYTHQ